jgi:PPK2 family polyphosphate:nucleotide phosphotransferase
MKKKAADFLHSLWVEPGKKVNLKTDYATANTQNLVDKEEGNELLQEGIANLRKLQDKLYAHNEYSVLIVLQAMDAAGKDGAIKHVMSGLNPQGVKVTSFKAPNSLELDHDYFWRHYRALPARGDIAIFNRSHYENVLVTRVHPEFILREKIPGISSVESINADFWKRRYDQINRFERNLAENGTIILKFFLHLSKDEQKMRFLERIDNPEKNWKFSTADINERQHWDEYMEAYEDLLSATSTNYAPWFVLPADDKWLTRLCMAAIIYDQFEQLNLSYPALSEAQLSQLKEIRKKLREE